MNGMSRKATGNPVVPLVVLLSLSMMSGAWAADAPGPADPAAAPPATEQLQELEQILVRGKSLSREISDAEDAFFAVYNKVNRNYDFSFTCGEASANPGSMIMLRACLPAFAIDGFRSSYRGQRAGFISYPTVMRCSPVSNADMNGDMFYTADPGCMAGGATYGGMTYESGGPVRQALISLRSRELAVHMLMVINSDPRLKELAGDLAELYQESNSMRTRYDRNRSVQPDAKPVKVNLGPRAM